MRDLTCIEAIIRCRTGLSASHLICIFAGELVVPGGLVVVQRGPCKVYSSAGPTMIFVGPLGLDFVLLLDLNGCLKGVKSTRRLVF